MALWSMAITKWKPASSALDDARRLPTPTAVAGETYPLDVAGLRQPDGVQVLVELEAGGGERGVAERLSVLVHLRTLDGRARRKRPERQAARHTVRVSQWRHAQRFPWYVICEAARLPLFSGHFTLFVKKKY